MNKTGKEQAFNKLQYQRTIHISLNLNQK